MTRARVVFIACFLAVAFGAVVLRLPRLALRPMHGDEANQAVKAGELLETGRYRYDPAEHHGPTLYYLTLPVLWAAGQHTMPEMSETALRVVPLVFGVGLVLLVLLVGDGLGRAAAAAGAALVAISPAMVFYSRYYVQEMLLVFFTVAAIGCGWRYVATRRAVWAALAGAMLGLMFATKETWIVAVVAMACGLAATAVWTRLLDGPRTQPRQPTDWRHLAVGAAAFAAVWFVLFSSFLSNPGGVADALRAYTHYADRAGGAGLHDNPWHYYLAMLAWSPWVTGVKAQPHWTEGLILGLALVGIVAALIGRGLGAASRGFARFLALTTLAMIVGYALIPYKTPWCALSFLACLALLAGVGAAALVRWIPTRPLKALVVLGLAVLAYDMAGQALMANDRMCADQRNPYVYAHTAPDALNLVKRVEEAAAVAPEGDALVIKVITPWNYWPLPWYLRRYPNVGYYHDVPDDPNAAVIITSPEVLEQVDGRLRGEYNMQSMYGLRPGVVMNVCVARPLWDALVEKWSAPRE
jgi:uncharacterized protein (TIGR03663 family)